ncbi:uncharacterized protein OCT59_003705 [Rhizophagus irregularis]|uniref:uncharacterized protein n=1 Tax=Rhizophagus irregularis TaxID=588596 RepID=UPI003318B57B|nr:hypothetical protein OCT59_003705 [Rhizophagus irregularis]
MDLGCNKHEISKTKVPQSILECCRNCLKILSFKQIEGYLSNGYLSNINDFNSKLCGKSLDKRTIRRCSDCCRIFFKCVESTLVKKQISILYLPWWCNSYSCINCSTRLMITSDSQKYYFDHIANSIDKYFVPETLLYSILNIFNKERSVKSVKWIPYSQFNNIREMTKGGYGIIYKADWDRSDRTNSYIDVILKRFENSKNNNQYFLNELKSNQLCKNEPLLIEVYGFAKDPESDDYILVMEYASGGDLHKKLQRKFTDFKWFNSLNNWYNYLKNNKLEILQDISKGCWNPDPKKRPPIKEICLTIYNWSDKGKNKEEFVQAEAKREKLIESKKIDYDYNYISKENELDISLPQNITIQNSSTSLKKRNTEDEIQDDSAGKRIKTS